MRCCELPSARGDKIPIFSKAHQLSSLSRNLYMKSGIRRIWLPLLFCCISSYGKDPDPKSSIDPCGPFLAAVVNGQRLKRGDIYDLLRSKFEIRLLGEGGPIAQ